MLSLDLRSEGPHALIAGTTGSGKSELLRTLVAAAAAAIPPIDSRSCSLTTRAELRSPRAQPSRMWSTS